MPTALRPEIEKAFRETEQLLMVSLAALTEVKRRFVEVNCEGIYRLTVGQQIEAATEVVQNALKMTQTHLAGGSF